MAKNNGIYIEDVLCILRLSDGADEQLLDRLRADKVLVQNRKLTGNSLIVTDGRTHKYCYISREYPSNIAAKLMDTYFYDT